MHLLIPFACLDSVPARQAVGTLQLPHLQNLLRRLQPRCMDNGQATNLSAAHERALALAHGINAPDGQLPLAAMARRAAGLATDAIGWAWVTPAHWDVAAAHITMADPASLDLGEEESRALLLAMQPYFEQDGIGLQFETAQRWWASGPVLQDLPSASLERVAGGDISRWMPSHPAIRRLQNEMQMLLYTHPVNEARAARRAQTVNSFWLHGTGALPTATVPAPRVDLVEVQELRRPALAGDTQAWTEAWQQVDQRHCAALSRAMQLGGPVQLTLCGPRHAQTFGPQCVGLTRRVGNWLRGQGLPDWWDRL
jgi:hypothetical protein